MVKRGRLVELVFLRYLKSTLQEKVLSRVQLGLVGAKDGNQAGDG